MHPISKLSELTIEKFDVIVIGAGPAGATAATVLAQEGRRVLLLEKQKFPRYHVGESLMPFCYFTLERLGLVEQIKEAGFVQKHSVQFVTQDGQQSRPFYFFQHRRRRGRWRGASSIIYFLKMRRSEVWWRWMG